MATRDRLGFSLLAAIPCVLIAPSAWAQQDAASAEATLEVSKGYEFGAGFGHAAFQSYFLSSGTDCRQWTRVGFLGWFTPEAKAVPLRVGGPMVVFSETQRNTGGGRYLFSDHCWNASAFTPQPGHQYRARQIAPRTGRCYIQVEDVQSGAAVATPLTIAPGRCAPPKGSEAAGYLQDYLRHTAESGTHSRDLYSSGQSRPLPLPPQLGPAAPALTQAASAPIPVPLTVSARNDPVRSFTPDAPIPTPPPPPSLRPSTSATPTQTWTAYNSFTPAPAPTAGDRVTDLRVNLDGSVSETHEH